MMRAGAGNRIRTAASSLRPITTAVIPRIKTGHGIPNGAATPLIPAADPSGAAGRVGSPATGRAAPKNRGGKAANSTVTDRLDSGRHGAAAASHGMSREFAAASVNHQRTRRGRYQLVSPRRDSMPSPCPRRSSTATNRPRPPGASVFRESARRVSDGHGQHPPCPGRNRRLPVGTAVSPWENEGPSGPRLGAVASLRR